MLILNSVNNTGERDYRLYVRAESDGYIYEVKNNSGETEESSTGLGVINLNDFGHTISGVAQRYGVTKIRGIHKEDNEMAVLDSLARHLLETGVARLPLADLPKVDISLKKI